MFLGLDALTLVVGGIIGIMIGASLVLYFTDRCYCYPPEDKNDTV